MMNSDILGLIFCAALIFLCGRKLSLYGDIIAELSGFGRAWIGLILMASVTSLPELMVGVSSAAIVQSADLAVGDILGSCAFNLGILALMDAFVPKQKPLFSIATQGHVLAAALGIILIALVGAGLFLPEEFIILPGIAFTSLLFLVIYLVSIRILFAFESKNKVKQELQFKQASYRGHSLRSAISHYSVFAILTIIAALFLPYFADRLAEHTGLGKTFVGTLILAASTSLPEIAVSLSAIRMGLIDMAVGNLLGSNIFNIFILFIDDLLYTNGNLLKDASDFNIVSVIATIIMSAIAIIGLTIRSQGKRLWLAWDTLLIFIVYLVNMILIFQLTRI